MNLIDEAEALMLHQFKDATKLKGLVRSLIKPLQSTADSIAALSDGCYLQKASHHRLDIKGKLVGQTRTGLSDEDLRTWIDVRIVLNRCSGTRAEIVPILQRLLGQACSFSIVENYPNDVVFVFFETLPVPERLLWGVIRRASPLGIKHHFIRADVPTPFRFDASTFSDAQFADFFKEEPHE